MALNFFTIGCWCPICPLPQHVLLTKCNYGRPIHSHYFLDPLPGFLSWKENWRGVPRELAISNESDEASLQMLCGFIEYHVLRWQVYYSSKHTPLFHEQISFELLQSPNHLLKLRDLGFLPQNPFCHASSCPCDPVSSMPHF
jgi:hypothetical protein